MCHQRARAFRSKCEEAPETLFDECLCHRKKDNVEEIRYKGLGSNIVVLTIFKQTTKGQKGLDGHF